LRLHRVVHPDPDAPLTDNVANDASLTFLESMAMPSGVLDCSWSPVGDGTGCESAASMLACATAAGSICMVKLDNEWRGDGCVGDGSNGGSEAAAPRMSLEATSEPAGYLFLSIDWDNRYTKANDARLAVSEAEGCVSVWRCAEGGELLMEHRWDAHTICGTMPSETWICRFNPYQPELLLSGADDTYLKGWDLRVGEGVGSGGGTVCHAEPAFVVRGQHDAGVTTLCWSSAPGEGHLFASGSYDEYVRLWDLRSLKAPVSTCAVGGGVWRLKWHPSHPIIAVAAMHNGAHLLDISDQAAPVVAGASYMRHGSMAYGIDWCHSDPTALAAAETEEERHAGNHRPLLASCSFYDSALHMWRAL